MPVPMWIGEGRTPKREYLAITDHTLLRIARRQEGISVTTVALAALNVLAYLGDCRWVDVARERVASTTTTDRLNFALLLAWIGDPTGWPVVREWLTGTREVSEDFRQWVEQVTPAFHDLVDPATKQPLTASLRAADFATEDVWAAFQTGLASALKRRKEHPKAKPQ